MLDTYYLILYVDLDIELNEPFILENQGEFYAQADPVEYTILFGNFQFIYKGNNLKVYCPANKESNIVTKFSKVSLIKTDEIVNVKENSEIYSINYLCDRMLIPQTVRGQDDYAECQHYSVGYQVRYIHNITKYIFCSKLTIVPN